jgi:hypothetical protein
MRIGDGASARGLIPSAGLSRRATSSKPLRAASPLAGRLAKGLTVAVEGLSELRSPGATAGRSQSAGLDRVKGLVESIRQTAYAHLSDSSLDSNRLSAGSAQQAIDSALLEIGNIIGTPLRLGGAENAAVSGVNDGQIVSYEVLSLPQNADVTIGGRVSRPPREVTLSVRHRRGINSVSGINQSQIAGVETDRLTPGSVATVSGTVDAVATAAELIYVGQPGGLVSGTATFRLTGPSGSADLSVTEGETLADAAQRINDATADTGIVAEVQGDTLRLASSTVGASATIVVDNVERDDVVSVGSINEQQVSNFQVVSMPSESEITIGGTVTQAARHAELTYMGGPGGVVVDSATFNLSGSLGSTSISITQGESLVEVAQSINDETEATGVIASTSGNDLLLSSVEAGSAASLAVELTDITQYIDVSGVNPSQISNFQVVAAEPDSQRTLSGSVTQAADAAQLTYTGFIGLVAANANFTLTGNLGSADISAFALEGLTTLRNRINLENGTTGVVASVSGNTLTLTSSGVGSAATVAVEVNSGSFNTSGGNGDGTANGTDAQLTINGQAVVGAGNNVSFADSLGSYTFTLASGFAGAFSTITVTSANGSFDVVGGNGDQTADGADALATINGQALVANGNTFSVNTGSGQFTLEIVDGFSGDLDYIEVASVLADFTIEGGDGGGADSGAAGQATINGQTLQSSNGTFVASIAGGDVTVTFADSFAGAFDPFLIRAKDRPTAIDAPVRPGRERRSVAVINGQRVSGTRGQFLFRQEDVEVSLQFAGRFRGEFDPIRITAGGDQTESFKSSPSTDISDEVRRILEPLFSLGSGGSAGPAPLGRAHRTTTDILSQLAANGIGQSSSTPLRSLRSGYGNLDLLA